MDYNKNIKFLIEKLIETHPKFWIEKDENEFRKK